MEEYYELISTYALSIFFAIAVFIIGKYLARKIANIMVSLLKKKLTHLL